LVDAVAGLIRQGALPASVHLANQQRSRSVLGGILGQRAATNEVNEILDRELQGAWSLSCPLAGAPSQVKLASREARRALGRIGKVALVTDRGLERSKAWCRRLSFLPRARRRRAFLEALELCYRHSKGVPSDAALASIAWPLGDPYT